MKKRPKALLFTLCAVLLVAATVLGTMAYLTATQTVENTFTVGKVALTLNEAKVDEYGVPVESAARVIANEYKLIPGRSYTKDPTVTVAKGSEESYVRMLVTINCQAEIDAINALGGSLDNIFTGYVPANWTYEGDTVDTTANTRTYEFRYKATVPSSPADTALPALFSGIKIPAAITGDELATLSNLKISVVAHAIQADGFADADAAWATW